jgi:hypothetical protein
MLLKSPHDNHVRREARFMGGMLGVERKGVGGVRGKGGRGREGEGGPFN